MKHLDTVIIGSGPGGYIAAIKASQNGQQVSLIETNELGGTCLNVGCIPSKSLLNISHQLKNLKNIENYGIKTNLVEFDYKKGLQFTQQRVLKKHRLGIQQLLIKNKVEVIIGQAHFIDSKTIEVISEGQSESYTFNNLVIAVGSKPIDLKSLPKSDRIINSNSLLLIDPLPQSMVVIGGGFIGVELTEAFSNLGVKITLVEGLERILPNFPQDMSDYVLKAFKKNNVEVLTSTMVTEAIVNDDGVTLKLTHNDTEKEIQVEKVLVSVGREANTESLDLAKANIKVLKSGLINVNNKNQTNQTNIYAIGDCVEGLALAHKASYEGKRVADIISNLEVEPKTEFIPAVCYTHPELAIVGLTLDEACKKGITAASFDFPIQANSLSSIHLKPEGFLRLTYKIEDKVIIGAQVVGMNGSELISLCTLACENKLNLNQITNTIFAHPSFSELFLESAEGGLGYPIHI